MVGFQARWDWLQAVLQDAAEEIGVASSEIVKGNWQQNQGTSLVPPGLILYLEPGDRLFGDDPKAGAATIRIFTVSRPQPDLSAAVGEAVDLAWRAVRALKRAAKAEALWLRLPIRPVEIDTVSARITAARIDLVTVYDIVEPKGE